MKAGMKAFPSFRLLPVNYMMMAEWRLKKFEKLTPQELYAILQLRNEIFVVEQNCVFQDADDKDQDSWHLMGWDEKKLIAYTRIIPPGIGYDKPSIGRVVISSTARRHGLGKELMRRSIENVKLLFGPSEIKLGAQLYLKTFY